MSLPLVLGTYGRLERGISVEQHFEGYSLVAGDIEALLRLSNNYIVASTKMRDWGGGQVRLD